MKDTTKRVLTAVLELAANKPETKEATGIVERLCKGYLGYKRTTYEWLQTTQSHAFVVEFSNRLPFVSISRDISLAIAMVHEDVLNAFTKPEADLSTPRQTDLERLDWPELSTESAA